MKMSMVSLGCDKNTVDSEMMLGLMNEKGFEYTDIDEEADVMIINTCGFIQSAKVLFSMYFKLSGKVILFKFVEP